MPIEFNRIQNSGYFNKYYGNYTAVSGWSTAPYSQGWSNRFGPPFANERIDTDGYDIFANPGICIGSGINQMAVPLNTDTNGKGIFSNDAGYRTPWYGPVNNIYKITIAGITNGSNPGDCTDCSLLNRIYYVNTTDTSIRGLIHTDSNGNTLVTPPVRVNNHIGSAWTGPVSRNIDAPCGNKLFTNFYGGSYYAVFANEPTSEFINLALIEDQPNIPITSGNIVLEVYIGPSITDVRTTEFSQSNTYNVAFSKNFGRLNLTGGHQNDNRPLMLEGIHNLTPTTGTLYYGTLIQNSGDNRCNYSSATCAVEPYKTEDWDFRQTRHFFEEPYGLISYQNSAPMCSGIAFGIDEYSFSSYAHSVGYANLIPSAFYLAFSGITNKFTNELCVPCDTYFSKPVTLKQTSATNANIGFGGGIIVSTNRYEWAGNYNSSSYLTKYNICEYGAYDYIRLATAQSDSLGLFGVTSAMLGSLNPTNPSGYISFGNNKIRLDVVSSGYVVPFPGGTLAGSGYRDLSALARISIVNGPAVGPTYTKVLCSDITSCINGGSAGSSYYGRHSHSGILPCLSSDFWNGGWTVDSGIVMEDGYGVSPAASSIYYTSSVAHLCDFTSSQPIIRTNTDFSRGLEPSRQNPIIFCTNKQVPQTLTVSYTSISGSVTYVYNQNYLTNSWGDTTQVLLQDTIGRLYVDDSDYIKFIWNLKTTLTGGSIPASFYNGAFYNSPYPQEIVIAPNIGSSGNRKFDCSSANWTGIASGVYTLNPLGGNTIVFNISVTLGDFVTMDYP